MKTRVVTVAICTAAVVGVWGADPKPYVPARDEVKGKELVLVYIGATNCGFCRLPSVKAAVVEAKSILSARAANEHRSFSAIGAALDYDIEDGLAFLKDVGPFDEVIVGRDFDNSAVLDLLSNSDDAIVGIPQLVVYERTITHQGHTVTASRPKVLTRIPGTGIPLWVQAGAKLPGGG